MAKAKVATLQSPAAILPMACEAAIDLLQRQICRLAITPQHLCLRKCKVCSESRNAPMLHIHPATGLPIALNGLHPPHLRPRQLGHLLQVC